MRVTTVDMFGVAPGRGSTLDVLVPEDPHGPHGVDGAGEATAAEEAAAHARRTPADESALVVECRSAERTFASRIFNAAGETPFATHSLAGTAAYLVGAGCLPAGEVSRTAESGTQPLWTDGREVRVPFAGPLVHEEVPYDAALFGPYTGTPYAGGVGRAFTLLPVTEDPRTLPAPDPGRMRERNLTDLILYRWDPVRAEVLARVFAPGFGIPEDAGCLPAAAALGATALGPATDVRQPVTVRQVTARRTESVFHCTGSVRDGAVSMTVTGRVWTGGTGDREAGASRKAGAS
ncbi:hypothetical protein GCM10023336_17240 [Streptomyces similanensis]|uniref:PhzF family phenazine biosynthesis protein n=1 Tax=Streptomyces similanensis TaxID=1274988 RepID=A0ABP9K4I1_9ACTN